MPGWFSLSFAYNEGMKDTIKSLPGSQRRYNPDSRSWDVHPNSYDAIIAQLQLFPHHAVVQSNIEDTSSRQFGSQGDPSSQVHYLESPSACQACVACCLSCAFRPWGWAAVYSWALHSDCSSCLSHAHTLLSRSYFLHAPGNSHSTRSHQACSCRCIPSTEQPYCMYQGAGPSTPPQSGLKITIQYPTASCFTVQFGQAAHGACDAFEAALNIVRSLPSRQRSYNKESKCWTIDRDVQEEVLQAFRQPPVSAQLEMPPQVSMLLVCPPRSLAACSSLQHPSPCKATSSTPFSAKHH